MTTFCFMTKAWRSGAAWVAQLTVQAILDKEVGVVFVAPLAEPEGREPRGRLLTRLVTPRELVGAARRHVRVYASLRRIFFGWWSIARARFQTNRFVFSIPDPLLFTLPMFAVLRLTGAHVILIVHDAEPHAWSLGHRLRFLERGALAMSYRLSTRLIALTESVRGALNAHHGIPPEKVSIIPHGPFTIGPVQPLPGTHRYLLFGTLRRNKGIREVIDGILSARQQGLPCQLVLAGEPHAKEAGYWSECLAAMRVDPDGFEVRAGFFPDAELPALLDTVDCFILAYSDFDSQSGVGVLATLASRPMIATRAGGLADLMALGAAAVTMDPPPTAAAVREAILEFERVGVVEWRRRAAIGAQRLAESFRTDKIADAYLRLADELP